MKLRKVHGALAASVMIAIFSGVGITTVSTAAQKIDSIEQIPFKFAAGQQKYEAMCATCHGQWLRGTDNGPPLLHGYYEPSHHNDRSFYRAILQGTQAHHWNFGDMPPVAGATAEDAQQIVPFVRWIQQQEGLF